MTNTPNEYQNPDVSGEAAADSPTATRSPLAGVSSDELRAALAERGELPLPQPLHIAVPAAGILFFSALTGRPLVQIGEHEGGGALTVFDTNGAVVASMQASSPGVGHIGPVVNGCFAAHLTGGTNGGTVAAFDDQGRIGVALTPTQSGGECVAYDHDTGKETRLAAPSLLTEAFPAGLHSPHRLN